MTSSFEMIELEKRPVPISPDLVESVGSDDFAEHLLKYVKSFEGLDETAHVALYHLSDHHMTEISMASVEGLATCLRLSRAYKEHLQPVDPLSTAVLASSDSEKPRLYRMDVADVPPGAARDILYGESNIHQRLILAGNSSSAGVCLSIMQPNARFIAGGGQEIASIADNAGMLIALAAKHIRLSQRRDFSAAFTSLTAIEQCIDVAPEKLSRREAQVCARILYGQLTTGIALDLEIGEETVVTYRKRAYQRIGIATRQELLRWYIDNWSQRLVN